MQNSKYESTPIEQLKPAPNIEGNSEIKQLRSSSDDCKIDHNSLQEKTKDLERQILTNSSEEVGVEECPIWSLIKEEGSKEMSNEEKSNLETNSEIENIQKAHVLLLETAIADDPRNYNTYVESLTAEPNQA